VSGLYVLKIPEPDTAALWTRYQELDPREGAPETCAHCKAPMTMPVWRSPFRVRLVAAGMVLSDVAFGSRPDVLVTREFQKFWNDAGLTGLSGFEPAEVLDVSNNTTFSGQERAYLHCAVQRIDAMLDEKESEAERTGGMPCAHCGSGGVLKHLRRVVLKALPPVIPDLFTVKGLATAVLASARLAEKLNAAHISGCLLVPADQIRAL
jgi:hypothetical protein